MWGMAIEEISHSVQGTVRGSRSLVLFSTPWQSTAEFQAGEQPGLLCLTDTVPRPWRCAQLRIAAQPPRPGVCGCACQGESLARLAGSSGPRPRNWWRLDRRSKLGTLSAGWSILSPRRLSAETPSRCLPPFLTASRSFRCTAFLLLLRNRFAFLLSSWVAVVGFLPV